MRNSLVPNTETIAVKYICEKFVFGYKMVQLTARKFVPVCDTDALRLYLIVRLPTLPGKYAVKQIVEPSQLQGLHNPKI